MLRKMPNCLPILLLTLSLLTMSAFAQDASRTTDSKGTNSRDVKANSRTGKHVKSNAAGTGFQVLHAFTGGSDGKNPQVGVNLDSSGNIYGATAGESGTNSDWGTIYEYTGTGNYSVLYNFQNGADGYTPKLPLPPNSSGNIYGGALYQSPSIDGIIYQFNPTTTTFTPLYSSGGLPEQGPSSLISDSSGNLYGFGTNGANGFGDVFMFNPTTGAFTDLYDFNGGTDGGTLTYGTLVIDASGNLYGATTRGGSSSNYGVVFEVSYSSSGNCPTGSNQSPGSSWCETVLYQFAASDRQLRLVAWPWMRPAISTVLDIAEARTAMEGCGSSHRCRRNPAASAQPAATPAMAGANSCFTASPQPEPPTGKNPGQLWFWIVWVTSMVLPYRAEPTTMGLYMR